jgi:hypothetical protein
LRRTHNDAHADPVANYHANYVSNLNNFPDSDTFSNSIRG